MIASLPLHVTVYIPIFPRMLRMNPFSRLRGEYSFVRGNFLLLTVTWILMFFALPIPNTYAGLYYRELGASDFLLSVIARASLLGDLTPRDLRGKVVGCSQFFIYLSQEFSQLLIGLLYSYVWRPLPFVMLAVGAVPVSLLVFFKVFEAGTKQV